MLLLLDLCIQLIGILLLLETLQINIYIFVYEGYMHVKDI